jgi:drug/metabolite transporter (DMT)-like permease
VVEGLVQVRSVPDRRTGTGYAMVVCAALLWAVNGSVAKVMLDAGMPSTALAELRATAAFLGLLAVVVATRPRTLRMERREIPIVALYGVVGFAAVQLFYLVAIKRLPVGIALLIEFTAPLLVALWVRFARHEPVRRRVWAALALSLVGLSFVAGVWGGVTLDGLGVLAALAAALSLAVYFVLGERAVVRRDPISLTCLAFGFASSFWAVVRPWWRFPFAQLGRSVSLQGNLSTHHLPMWLLAVWLVLLGTIVPFTLSIGALRHLRAAQVGVVGMLEPVAASVVAMVWLAETLDAAQVVGGILVLVGIVLAETARRRGSPPAAGNGTSRSTVARV